MDDDLRDTESIEALRAECRRLQAENDTLQRCLAEHGIAPPSTPSLSPPATPPSAERTKLSTREKVTLFRSLFRGREDVYAVRWQSPDGRSAYSPKTERDWKAYYAAKPEDRKRVDKETRKFLPLTDEVIHGHLSGDLTVGMYPLLQDETSWFLAVDLDKKTWHEDALVFLATCGELNVPAALERCERTRRTQEMTRARHYSSGPALRTALEERLKKISRDEAIDLQRLRRQVAFDRFLVRLFAGDRSDWVLKGGYAMELRFQMARATRNLDFTVRSKPGGAGDMVLALLQDVGAVGAGDHFTFRVGEAGMDLDGSPYGGSRYPVEAIMAGRTFVKFHLDVGIGDVIVDPPDTVPTRDWLGFAGLGAPLIPVIQSEQQFAEKIHTYTLPRDGAPNSRVRDLSISRSSSGPGIMDTERVAEAIRRTFARRGTHDLPADLAPPPENWVAPFAAMAEECSLGIDAATAFQEVAAYLRDVRRQTE